MSLSSLVIRDAPAAIMGIFDNYLYYFKFGEGECHFLQPPPPPTTVYRVDLSSILLSPLVGERVGLTHRDISEQIYQAVPSPCHQFIYVLRLDREFLHVLVIEKLHASTLESATVYRVVGYEPCVDPVGRINNHPFPFIKHLTFLHDNRTLLMLPIESHRVELGKIRTIAVYEVEFNEVGGLGGEIQIIFKQIIKADCTAVLTKFHFPPLPNVGSYNCNQSLYTTSTSYSQAVKLQDPELEAEYHLLEQIGFYSPSGTLRDGLFYHLDLKFRLFVLNTPQPEACCVPGGTWEPWDVDDDINELKVGVSESWRVVTSEFNRQFLRSTT